MSKIFLNPWLIGIVAFIAMRLSLGEIFDLRPRCEDGWLSPSIGKSGACSYHGGVDRSIASSAFLFSVIFAAVLAFFSSVILEKIEISKLPQIEDGNKVQRPLNENDAVKPKVIPSFSIKFSDIANSSIEDVARKNEIAIIGQCIPCRKQFNWRGEKIVAELQEYLSTSINSIRGKLLCPECNSPLQITYKEESSP